MMKVLLLILLLSAQLSVIVCTYVCVPPMCAIAAGNCVSSCVNNLTAPTCMICLYNAFIQCCSCFGACNANMTQLMMIYTKVAPKLQDVIDFFKCAFSFIDDIGEMVTQDIGEKLIKFANDAPFINLIHDIDISKKG